MIRPTKFEIACDGCGEVYCDVMGSEWSDVNSGVKDALLHGWIYFVDTAEGKREDYCPKCREEKGM